MALIATILGGLLILTAAGMGLVLHSKLKYERKDENTRLAAFLLAWLGSWLFLFGGWALLLRMHVIRIRMTWLLGIAIGFVLSFVPAFLQVVLWAEDGSRHARRVSPEEGLGGGGCAIFGALVSVAMGLVFGAVLGAIL
jgi:hypothetical protein